MSTTTARLFLTPEVRLPGNGDPDVIAGFTLDVEPFDTVLQAAQLPSVGILTPAQARKFLGVAPAGKNTLLVLYHDRTMAPLDPALTHHRAVAGILTPETDPAALHVCLKSAFGLAGQRAADLESSLEKVLEVGRALSSIKDINQLLTMILDSARHLTNSDGASVYTVEKDGRLYFRVWQNTSTGNGQNDQAVPVSKNSIASFVAKTGELLVIDDAYRIAPDKPYRFLSDFDSRSNYVTRSLLTVPLTNKAEEVVGVLQLINRKRDSDVCLKSKADVDSQVLPFDQSSEQVALALAGQAGVALENARLHKDIENVFEGFVNASVTAIESRDPSTAGHSFRVAALTEKLAIMADRTDRYGLKKTHFTREQLKELRYAALLHDFGKVGVREHVLLKAKKLYPRQLELIQQRFRLARLSVREAGYRQLVNLQREKQFDHDSFETQYRQLQVRIRQELAQLDSYMQLILQANEPSVLDSEASAELQKLHAVRFMDDQEQSLPLIEPYEFDSLSLSRGSLRPEERQEIESHVSHTYAFLKLIPWTRDFAALPDIAHAHHEKMDGTGYPRGLTAEEIPVQSRMMTIADIYDALTAADRPYKQAVPVERALTILQSEADAGKLDPDLLALFLDARVYAAADD